MCQIVGFDLALTAVLASVYFVAIRALSSRVGRRVGRIVAGVLVVPVVAVHVAAAAATLGGGRGPHPSGVTYRASRRLRELPRWTRAASAEVRVSAAKPGSPSWRRPRACETSDIRHDRTLPILTGELRRQRPTAFSGWCGGSRRHRAGSGPGAKSRCRGRRSDRSRARRTAARRLR